MFSCVPAQLVRGFITLSELLNLPWSQVPSPLPPPSMFPCNETLSTNYLTGALGMTARARRPLEKDSSRSCAGAELTSAPGAPRRARTRRGELTSRLMLGRIITRRATRAALKGRRAASGTLSQEDGALSEIMT